VAVGHGGIEVYPGTYEQFLWSRTERAAKPAAPSAQAASRTQQPTHSSNASKASRDRSAIGRAGSATAPSPAARPGKPAGGEAAYEEKKKADAETRRKRREQDERNRRIAELEGRITEREQAIKALESQMSAPGFYDNRELADTILSKHHSLMWEVGDLMNQWEALQDPSETH